MNFKKENLEELFTLGDLFVSDFVNDEPLNCEKHELKLMYCSESKLVKLSEVVDSNKMYGKYWYRSGINDTMKKQLKDVVESCLYVKPFVKNGLWLDIACNDGTMFKFIPETYKKLGIDPCDNSYLNESKLVADDIVQDYFSFEAYSKSKFAHEKCDVITCIAMFYDLYNPLPFLNDVHKILKDDGIFVIQMSYTPLMAQQLAFDNICHEHAVYYSLHSLQNILNQASFKVVDCELNDVNGSSFRVFCQKDSAPEHFFANAPYRDVANYRLKSILEYENLIGANEKQFYLNFFEKINHLKNNVFNFINKQVKNGKKVWAYGASTKGNTLLQYFNLDNSLIQYAVERSPYKIGLKTVGTNIPIISESEMRINPPDYLLILPWHFVEEFKSREDEFLSKGGKFIVPCPKLEIIQK